MNEYVVNYLKKDIEGYYFDKRNNEYKLKGVCCSFDRTRKDKALKQAKLEPVSFVKVYSYVNEFLELVREENGFTEKNIKIDTIKLDGKEHIIIDNGILVTVGLMKTIKEDMSIQKRLKHSGLKRKQLRKTKVMA